MGGIAIIAERAAPQRGGLAVATARIAAHAAQSGERVHVIYPTKDAAGGTRGRRLVDGVIYHPVGLLPRDEETLIGWSAHAKEIIESESLDLIHGIYATRAGYIAALLGRELDLPSIVSLRGNDLDRGRFRGQDLPFLELALTRASVVTGVSRALCQTAERLFDVRAVHITNSVDSERFSVASRDNTLARSLGLSNGTVLGFLGELREKKGMRFLLPALDELLSRPRNGLGTLRSPPSTSPKTSQEVDLLLIGGVRGECEEAFQAFSRMAPRAFERIHVIEYDRDPGRICRLMALCDLMVFPSLYDGTPNAVLEAMAAGQLILATDAGGQRDLITHGENGALLPVGQLDRLPEAIEELLALPQHDRSKMAKAARERVMTHHRPEQEREAYAALYRQLRRSR